MKNKVGIITFHRAINYGAVLQTYALVTYLQSKGFVVEVIDYFPKFLQKYHYYKLPKRPIDFIIRLLNVFQFNRFVKKKLPKSAVQYTSNEELKANLPAYDYYITGSDQVWSSNIPINDLKAYFLDFVPQGKLCKVSYAASMGHNYFLAKDTNYIKQALSDFKDISVREPFAKQEIAQLGLDNVEIVLDPTLLLDKSYYETVFVPIKKKDYILVFDLNKSKLLEECALKVSAQTGIPIINILGFKNYAKNKIVSPVEWLSYINGAKYIFTNSFHGTSFSIIFNKNFFCIEQEKKQRNNRAINLLGNLDISDRFIQNVEDVDIEKQIDYEKVKKKLDVLRSKSFDFLNKALIQ